MSDTFSLEIDNRTVWVGPGVSVAAAMLAEGVAVFRRSVTGAPRGPVCGMGVCFECRVTIDGVPHRLSCQTQCAPGMKVRTDDP
jgi:predicted molibdopterin-dependent oxidoreductase YjgC